MRFGTWKKSGQALESGTDRQVAQVLAHPCLGSSFGSSESTFSQGLLFVA